MSESFTGTIIADDRSATKVEGILEITNRSWFGSFQVLEGESSLSSQSATRSMSTARTTLDDGRSGDVYLSSESHTSPGVFYIVFGFQGTGALD